MTRFLEEFDDFLSVINTLPGRPLLLGDLNIHVNKPSKYEVVHYLTSLAEHDIHQYVTEPTHKCGNTLDHVVCRPGDDILSSHSVSPFKYGSDHNMIHCEINIAKPVPDRRVIKSRSHKDLDMTLFEADLKQATDCVFSEEDPNVQADIYNTKVRAVLDKHCPEQ